MLGLDEVHAFIEQVLQKIDDQRLAELLARVGHVTAAPVIRAEGFGQPVGPDLDPAIGDHHELKQRFGGVLHVLGDFLHRFDAMDAVARLCNSLSSKGWIRLRGMATLEYSSVSARRPTRS